MIDVVLCENTELLVCSAVVQCRLLVFLTSDYSHHLAAKSGAEYVRPFLMVLHHYWSRQAQCILVAHHGYWVSCDQSETALVLGAGRNPRCTMYMTHWRVAMLWHLPIQPHAALQVDAYRQWLGEGNSEIKPHSHSYCQIVSLSCEASGY